MLYKFKESKPFQIKLLSISAHYFCFVYFWKENPFFCMEINRQLDSINRNGNFQGNVVVSTDSLAYHETDTRATNMSCTLVKSCDIFQRVSVKYIMSLDWKFPRGLSEWHKLLNVGQGRGKIDNSPNRKSYAIDNYCSFRRCTWIFRPLAPPTVSHTIHSRYFHRFYFIIKLPMVSFTSSQSAVGKPSIKCLKYIESVEISW